MENPGSAKRPIYAKGSAPLKGLSIGSCSKCFNKKNQGYIDIHGNLLHMETLLHIPLVCAVAPSIRSVMNDRLKYM